MYVDFLVVGAGPAGIQAAIFLQERNADYLVLEKNDFVGTHFRSYPRHRQLISINKKHTGSSDPDFNLRHDWNSLLTTDPAQPRFTTYSDQLYPSADVLCDYLDDVVESHCLKIKKDISVEKISRIDSGLFEISTNGNTYTAKYLLMATGGSPWYPGISGIRDEHVDTYEGVSLDKSEFVNKKVLILGKGNSAFECAEYLSDSASVIHLVSPRQINFAWDTRYVGDLRSIRNNILDLYQLKSQFVILNASVASIQYMQGEQKPFKVDFEFTFTPEDPYNSMRYDRVIACTGFSYLKPEMFDSSSIHVEPDPRPILKGKFPLITPEWEYSDVPRMYALGAMMQTVNYRKNAGGFIHGFRYTIRSLIDLIFFKEYDSALRHSAHHSLEDVQQELFHRINTASSLYQMYGELCDVVVASDKSDSLFDYYYDLPLSFVKSQFRGQNAFVLKFAIASRPNEQDAFKYIPEATPSTPEKSVFIHPVLSILDSSGALSDDLHLLENIDIEWSDPDLHVKPVKEFLGKYSLIPVA